ncbi:YaaC family protein [Fibrobacter sp.]|uniref:YaaC family protein n=1 Tax=Fibrobacter sp. TaxID=35828 RepID=UPI0038907159
MTEYEVWQNLRPLESFDNVKAWFCKIHGRTLNSRRASEIACAAKQAREYFRNARQADYSVRSLLTFYGVASLWGSLHHFCC